MDLNAAPVRTVAFTALIAIIVNVLAGHPDVPRAPQLRSLPHRQLVEPPEIMLYDPDGCTPAGIKWSAGDCGLVERYLQAGHVALYKRNMLAMGSKTDADGHSCAAAFWEPGPAGSCCNYSPRVGELPTFDAGLVEPVI